MNWKHGIATKLTPCLLVLLTLGCRQDAPREVAASPASTPAATQPTPADRIAIAMSAAPASIAAGATIMDFDASGKLVELRPGTNGWLCLADDGPTAPGDSPDCLDERWQSWFTAFEQRKVPKITGIGLAYMLQGSLTPSNSDPFAETPPSGGDWMKDGPHVMVIVPDPAILNAFSGEHSASHPYVMYKGTPYAHLMVPVSAKQ